MGSQSNNPGGVTRRAPHRLGSTTHHIVGILAAIAGIAIVAMATLITVNVVMRAFGAAILGIEEVVQMLMVPVIFLAIGFCALIDGHIRVDVLHTILPKGLWAIVDPLTRIVVGLCFAILCWRGALTAIDAAEFGETTNLLRIPHAPFWWTLSIGAGLAALIEFARLMPFVGNGDDGVEEDDL